MNRWTEGRGWPRFGVLLGICTFGAVLGAYGWTAHEQVAELSAAALEVNLIAGSVSLELGEEGDGWNSGLVGTIYYHGRRDVTILAARPAGWVPVGDGARPIPIPPREWTSVPLAATPDCTAPVRPELELLVRTERGDRQVTVPFRQSGEYLALFHQSACLLPEFVDIEVVDADALPPDDGALVIRLGLRHIGPPDGREITVLGVGGETAGFRATSSDLPIVLPPGATQTITMRWSVNECTRTAELAEVDVVVRLKSPDLGRQNQPVYLPGHIVAALARFGVAECAG
ncbi:MAG TPA: hypothetical protein VFZ63_01030 [Jiangellaceae bacterium]